MITRSASGWPITSAAVSRTAGRSATCGANPSSRNAARLSELGPGDEGHVAGLGQSPPLARRCASATVSNHALGIAGSSLLTELNSGQVVTHFVTPCQMQ